MSLIRTVCLMISFLLAGVAAATPASDCVLLGPQPSFIIKLKNNPSDLLHSSQLSTTWLNHLSELSHLQFTHSHAMAWGAYVVSFIAPQPDQVCYSATEIARYVDHIQQDPQILYAEPNALLRPLSLNEYQWNMDVSSGGGIDALNAWDLTQANANVVVADLDTGILDNADLNPNLRAGVSFYGGASPVRTTGAAPQCSDASCGYYHGTHTAGTIAGSGTLAYGYQFYGVAPQANLIPINTFTKFTNACTCSNTCDQAAAPCLLTYNSDWTSAVAWLTGTHYAELPDPPHVVAANMSFGGAPGGSPPVCSSMEQTAITSLINQNIVPVIAAGNSNVDAATFTPASCIGAIVVAATGATKLKAAYSNFGDIISVAAPGGDSSIGLPATRAYIWSTAYQTYYGATGTSMAAPHVAGLVALLYARDPTMTRDRALSIIQSTAGAFAIGTGNYNCRNLDGSTRCGAGIIDAAAAVAAITPPTLNWTPNLVVNSLSATSAQISWTAPTWSNSATTGIIYNVSVDSVAVSNCQNISAQECVITDLSKALNGEHFVRVTATDYRQILTPIEQSTTFILTLTPPTLTSAVRNPDLSSEVWLNYSEVGTDLTGNMYIVNGVPDDVTISLDKSNQRFVLENVGTQEITGVSITVSNPNFVSVTSNPVTIANVDFSAPTLTFAVRNPAMLTQAWIYYSGLGTVDSDNIYTFVGLSGDEKIVLDTQNKRFILSQIATPKDAHIAILVSNTIRGTVQSIPVRLPSIAG